MALGKQLRTSLERLTPYRYNWPFVDFKSDPNWILTEDGDAYIREMPENEIDLANDSRWAAFFPSPICFVTTSDGEQTVVEKAVGALIVNRFPYVIAVSFCRKAISERHYERKNCMEILERSRSATVQFFPPGNNLDKIMKAIKTIPDSNANERIGFSGVPTFKSRTNDSPILSSAYMAYESSFVKPQKDCNGQQIHEKPYIDAGSHRIYFMEINAIQLREDIASGKNQIHWRSLPSWNPSLNRRIARARMIPDPSRYQKGYTPYYSFPARNTVAFESDIFENGYAIKLLPPLLENQVEVDNDRARWPCFYPSSVAMISSWAYGGKPNVMPCGSTTIVSRHPFIVAAGICYSPINERYAARASLEFIRKTGWFGCGVPYIHDSIIEAITFAGNNSFRDNPDKVFHSGFEVGNEKRAPVLLAMPIHFECAVVGEVRLGTHVLFLGEVKRIRVRADVSTENALEWFPFADVEHN